MMSSRFARAKSRACIAVGVAAALSASVGVAAATAAKPAAKAKSSTFVVGATSSVLKLDPDIVTNFLDFQALGVIYDPLVQYNASSKIVPDLATSWKYSNGGKALTFVLRRNVKFDDGTTFTSANVVASIKRAQAKATDDPSASYVASVTKVVPQGKYKVKFVLKTADTSVLDGLTSVNLAMLSTKAIKAGSVAKKPDGTGPFEYKSYTPDQSFTVSANPSYWGGAPKLSSVEFKTIPTESSIAAALKANTVQLGLMTDPTVATHLPSSFKVDKTLDSSYRAIMINSTSSPFSNEDNRLALACAISRQNVVQAALLGQGESVGPVPLGQYKSNPTAAICPTQDTAKAKSYLAAAGNPSGFSFTILVSDDIDGTTSAAMTEVQNELAQVGITMTINNESTSQYVQDWLAGNFQATYAENGANPNPYVMYNRYFGTGASLGKPAGYANSTLASMLTNADAATTPKAEASDYKAVSTFLTKNAVWDWLFDGYQYAAMSSKVKGFILPPDRQLYSLKSVSVG
jgi:peptide/nickel transport system substrate-binding protein